MLATTFPIMKDTLRILMQAVPPHQDHEKVTTALLEIKVMTQLFYNYFIYLLFLLYPFRNGTPSQKRLLSL